MGDSIEGVNPQKVLFLGLEEFWQNRVNRNFKQYSTLNKSQKKLFNKNYLYQPIDFLKFIQSDKDWQLLKRLIKSSGAKYAFIDSITRMNHGNLEDSKVAQEIMQKLRDITYELQITLICIHHTPKMYGKSLVMDSIKGSSVFAQESDFAIGINRVNKRRYQKDIFFRYKDDNTEKVKEFEINDNYCLDYIGDEYEYDILNGEDGRKNTKNKDEIEEFFKKSTCKYHKTADLIKYFETTLSIKERQIKAHLSKLVLDGVLKKESTGVYKYSECSDNGMEVLDEE